MRVEVDIDIADIETDDLIDVLRYQARHGQARHGDEWMKYIAEFIRKMDIVDIIKLLESLGCPQDIIASLEQWEEEYVPCQADLDRWLMALV